MNQELAASCLNCATPLQGVYCHQCGQKNLPAKLSVIQLLVVFFGEFFNYDGLVFRSIRLLITRPAGLTLAYMEGKRTNYVNPVRFYLFTSALYFLLITYLVSPPVLTLPSGDSTSGSSSQQAEGPTSELWAKGILDGFEEGQTVAGKDVGIQSEFQTYIDYLAHQQTLPVQDRASEFELRFVQKYFEVKSIYGDDTSFTSAFGNEVLKRLPQLLLLTLPLLALVSKFIFFRRRHYWYIDHLIFVLHLATSLFFLLFAQQGIDWMVRITDQSWLQVVGSALGLGWLGYVLLCFKRFFEKSWGKTLLLFCCTAMVQGLVLLLVFSLLLVVSFFNL